MYYDMKKQKKTHNVRIATVRALMIWKHYIL